MVLSGLPRRKFHHRDLARKSRGEKNRKISRKACPERSRKGRKGAKEERCHFEPFGQAQGKLREKFFMDPSYSLRMTGTWPVNYRVGDLARANHFSWRAASGRKISAGRRSVAEVDLLAPQLAQQLLPQRDLFIVLRGAESALRIPAFEAGIIDTRCKFEVFQNF